MSLNSLLRKFFKLRSSLTFVFSSLDVLYKNFLLETFRFYNHNKNKKNKRYISYIEVLFEKDLGLDR